jgi:hypothetical protein
MSKTNPEKLPFELIIRSSNEEDLALIAGEFAAGMATIYFEGLPNYEQSALSVDKFIVSTVYDSETKDEMSVVTPKGLEHFEVNYTTSKSVYHSRRIIRALSAEAKINPAILHYVHLSESGMYHIRPDKLPELVELLEEDVIQPKRIGPSAIGFLKSLKQQLFVE